MADSKANGSAPGSYVISLKRDTSKEVDTARTVDTSGNPESPRAGKKMTYINFLQTYRWYIVLGAFALTMGIMVYAFSVFGVLAYGGFNAPNSESTRATQYFKRYYVSPEPDVVIVLEYPGHPVATQEFKEAYLDLKAHLQAYIPEVYGIYSYFEYPNTPGLVSFDGNKCIMAFRLPQELSKELTLHDYEAAVGHTPLTTYFSGTQLITNEVTESLKHDLEVIETGSSPVLFVILVFAYGGLAASTIPIILSVWTLIMTLASLHMVAIGFNVSVYVTNVATAFGVGIAVDYSIFMHLRFTEEMRKHKDNPYHRPVDAIEKMVFTSGRTILFSGILLVTTLLTALQFSLFYLTTMALTMVFVATYASIGACLIVPAYYCILETNVFRYSTDPITNYAYDKFTLLLHKLGFKVVPMAEQKDDFDALSTTSSHKIGNSDEIKENDNFSQNGSSKSVQSDKSMLGGHRDDDAKTVDSETKPSLVTAADRADYWFVAIDLVVRYPWQFLLPLMVYLVVLTALFIKNVKLDGFSWAVIPVGSSLRTSCELQTEQFQNSGKTRMDIYIQTRGEIIGNQAFITALDKFCTELESRSFITGVNSMVRLDPRLNLTNYLYIYSFPDNPENRNYTQQVKDPFFYSDLKNNVRVSLGSSVNVAEGTLGFGVLNVRHLLAESFKNPDGSSMIGKHGVTGTAAVQYDYLTELRNTLPGFIASICILMFVFITLLTGSVILPFKSIVSACLSMSSSFAYLMFVFQDGFGAEFLNFRNNFECLDPINLIFIFIVGFGLSLDYEVFLLGRMQEIFERTGDNNYSVAKGVSSSARSITIAAILICTAVLGFLHSTSIILKMIGMGIGLCIVFDATVIRCVLLPSFMALLGEWNWWAPEWVKRIVEFCGIQEKESA